MPPVNGLYAFMGLIASGKSTLAAAWAAEVGAAYYNSDRVRKELAGLAPTAGREAAWNQGIYSGEMTRRTYDELLARAEEDLRQGRAVVLDASYQARPERDRVRALAERAGRDCFFVHCVCPEDEMRRRMAIRARDPLAVSDGRWEIYLAQKEKFELPTEIEAAHCITISTVAPVPSLVASLAELLPAT